MPLRRGIACVVTLATCKTTDLITRKKENELAATALRFGTRQSQPWMNGRLAIWITQTNARYSSLPLVTWGFGEPLGNEILLDQLGKSGKKIEYSASTRWGIVETALPAETNQPKEASLSFLLRDPTPLATRE